MKGNDNEFLFKRYILREGATWFFIPAHASIRFNTAVRSTVHMRKILQVERSYFKVKIAKLKFTKEFYLKRKRHIVKN